jgi:LysM repeat protein
LQEIIDVVEGVEAKFTELLANTGQPQISTGVTPQQPVIQTKSNPPTTTNPSNTVTPPPVPTTVARPVTTTNPSQRSGSSALETIAKVSLAVAGVAAVANIVSNATKKTPATVTEPNSNANTTSTQNTVENRQPKPVSDPGTVTDYTVKAGDTLTSIARKYDTTVEALLKANPQIKNPDLIRVGEVIKIPGANQEPVAGTGANAPVDEPDNGGSEGSAKGLDGRIIDVQAAATAQDQANFEAFEDWRVRLSLAPDANYLYKADEPGILSPLASTQGVVFPYTPLISVNYTASYDQSTVTHSNYKIFQYQGSAVDSVSITCDFTAQDVYEANYLLAVIHFFRAATKMFYGQDQDPKPGTPPPLVYLFGLGGFQFEAHPLAITNFSYSLPNDVDYISTTTSSGGGEFENTYTTGTSTGRLPPGVQSGGTRPSANFDTGATETVTYVPTKIQLSISCLPIVSRNAISNKFSFKEYATGRLLQGTRNVGGGIW